MSAYDEPVFKSRKMMDTVRVGTNCYMDVGRLRIESYEPVLEFLEPYADYLICCVTAEAGLLYVQFNELTQKEQQMYPALMDLRAAQHYVSAPSINIDDWMKQMREPLLLPDFTPLTVRLTSARDVREILRDKTLNRVGASASSASSLQSESEGEYHTSSASSRGGFSINLEGRLRKLAGVNNAPSFGGGSSESRGGQEYRASSPFASSLHSESKGESSPSAGAISSMGIKESESLLGSSSSAASASPMIAGGPYGSSSAASAPQSAKQTFWGGLTGTVSSFLKPPPLHEKTPGPLGLPKRSGQTRRRARRRRLTRAA